MCDRLDLVVVNPGAQKQVYQDLSRDLSAIEPPVWVGLVATFARDKGYSVEILDAEAEGMGPEQVGEEISRRNPLLAAVIVFGSQPSASTQKMSAAGAITRAIREAAEGTRSLLAGVHVSALPRRTLEEETVDFVCEGEGPYTITGLVDLLRTGEDGDPTRVPGLWYREGEEIRSTPCAPLISDLDTELPGVAWDLLPMEKYRAHNWHCFDDVSARQPYAVLYTTLGCPFKCSFCCINAPFGGPAYRLRSPEKVLEEIDLLVGTYGVKNIKILDEMFVLNYPHVEAICDGLIERRYDLNFWAYARVDTVRSGVLPKMREAGIRWLALGIESASSYVRDGVDKDFKTTDIFEVVKSIQDAGIYVIGNFIFGLPDDTLESMQATLDMAKDLNCEMANFYCAMAYPGSKLYPMALEKGWPLPPAWHGYSQHALDSLPLPTETLKAGQVLRFRDDAFHDYFESPAYLEMIESRFGSDTRHHIEEMSRHRLSRSNYSS
jgi:anaerobic magnesium-protoporphyrin IX monomethyl ester cyclase